MLAWRGGRPPKGRKAPLVSARRDHEIIVFCLDDGAHDVSALVDVGRAWFARPLTPIHDGLIRDPVDGCKLLSRKPGCFHHMPCQGHPREGVHLLRVNLFEEAKHDLTLGESLAVFAVEPLARAVHNIKVIDAPDFCDSRSGSGIGEDADLSIVEVNLPKIIGPARFSQQATTLQDVILVLMLLDLEGGGESDGVVLDRSDDSLKHFLS